ncbi:MAG: NADH-quinone oxidoreductase subunit C, partial [Candidatus Omnitrophica bacterium]|nr:NADH-quinone oxidoreductase subunit C [Candidatus Omnitrophota bacterium]
MDHQKIAADIKKNFTGFSPDTISAVYPDELHLKVGLKDYYNTCMAAHKALTSPVMMMFASDEHRIHNKFLLSCVFLDSKNGVWVKIDTDVPGENPSFMSLAKEIYSSGLFEREIFEMFGIVPEGHPDPRRLALHDEVWPSGNYPLRKNISVVSGPLGEYTFGRVEGDGIFELPVGPVHA